MATLDPTIINAAIGAALAQAHAASAALVPVGTALTSSFITLGIVMLGASIITGNSGFIPMIVQFTGASAGTLWAVTIWPKTAEETLAASHRVIGMLTGSYDGPAGLFTLANDVAARILVQSGAASAWHPFDSVAEAVACALAAFFAWAGLCFTGILAILAELQLVIGACVAPLILPAMAFGFTRNIGFGPVRFMLSAGVRVIVLGVTSVVMAKAITSLLVVPGADQVLTFTQSMSVVLLGFLCAIAGYSLNSIAGDLVSGGVTSLGMTNIMSASHTMASGATVVGGAAVGAAKLGAAGVSAGAGALRGAGSRGVTTSSTGSPFGNGG